MGWLGETAAEAAAEGVAGAGDCTVAGGGTLEEAEAALAAGFGVLGTGRAGLGCSTCVAGVGTAAAPLATSGGGGSLLAVRENCGGRELYSFS